MAEYNNLMELVLDVGNHIYETHKRGTPSFTQQLYEEHAYFLRCIHLHQIVSLFEL